jgi:hypothetical protein
MGNFLSFGVENDAVNGAYFRAVESLDVGTSRVMSRGVSDEVLLDGWVLRYPSEQAVKPARGWRKQKMGNDQGLFASNVRSFAMNLIDAGTELTCTNRDCDCSLIVQNPCPHGDGYKCGCGYPLLPAGAVPEKGESAEIG